MHTPKETLISLKWTVPIAELKLQFTGVKCI